MIFCGKYSITGLLVLLGLTLGLTKCHGGENQFKDFVSVDREKGWFRTSERCFPICSVTYVQPEASRPGYNSGQILLYNFDFTKFRNDFAHMHALGINSIYMRVNSGFFLDAADDWRTIKSDPDFAARVSAWEKREPVGPFTYFYEIFDYLLSCAEKEGLYVIPVLMDRWSLPRRYELAEQDMAMLDDGPWRKVTEEWSKIAGKFRDRKAILGYLLEGEFIMLYSWNENYPFYMDGQGGKKKLVISPLETKDKNLTRQFQRFLERHYGTMENLKSHWRWGYDRSSPRYDQETGVPDYVFNPGVYDAIDAFSGIGLPTLEQSRYDDGVGIGKNFPYWTNVPLDPVWVDFAYFREWLHTEKFNQLFHAIRAADTNHLIIYSAGDDSAPVWHPFYTLWNKGQIGADVILHGGGYSETFGQKTLEVRKHENGKELYQSVGLFRAFTTHSQGRGRVFGMGEGGFAYESDSPYVMTQDVPETLADRWITQLLMDNYGSGSGLVNLWDWGTLTGATVANMNLHEHRVTKTLPRIMRALEKDMFTRNRHPRILILMNGSTLHSLLKPACHHNTIALANILTGLHYRFDIVSTDEMTLGHSETKVDISGYDAIFMPELFSLPKGQYHGETAGSKGENVWTILRDWITLRPHRVLCLGVLGMRGSHFAPLEELPEEFLALTGPITPGRLRINLGGVPVHDIILPQDTAGQSEPYFIYDRQVLAVKRALNNDAAVYQFGFPLGLSWMPMFDKSLSGTGINENQMLRALYGDILKKADIQPDYDAPASMVAYISDHAKTILVSQRSADGPRSGWLLSSPLIAGHVYGQVKTIVTRKEGKLTGRIVGELGDNDAAILTAIGTVEMIADGTVEIQAHESVAAEGPPQYTLEVTGEDCAKIVLTEGIRLENPM